MTRAEYMKRALDAWSAGRIDEETYDAMILNADVFCDEDDDTDERLPDTYAEIEYEDFDDPEAIEGAKWDDQNYLHYMER